MGRATLLFLLLSLTPAAAGTYHEALAAGTSREDLERDGVMHVQLDPDPDPGCTRLSGVGGAVHDASSFLVAAYLPEWRYEGANWATICATVTHLILFSIEVAPSGAVAALDRLPRPELMREARAAATASGTKLLLCIGGNGRSAGFSPMVASKAKRARFIAALLALCEEHGLDGVDYNWEYPGYAFGFANPALARRNGNDIFGWLMWFGLHLLAGANWRATIITFWLHGWACLVRGQHCRC